MVRSIHHGAHSQLYQARDGHGRTVAVKVVAAAQRGLLERERDLLQRAPSAAVSQVVGHGYLDDHAFLALDWRRGVDVRTVAAELRRTGDPAPLVRLAADVVRAFGSLHRHGTVHGQVHPRHVLVDADRSICLVDLTQAALPVGHLSDPTAMGRWLRGEPPETASACDEQYSVAALVFLLLTGAAPFGAIRGRRELAETVRDECAPVPAGAAGSAVNDVVRRALSLDPDDRFASLDAFADALSTGASVTDPVLPAASYDNPLAKETEHFIAEAAPGPTGPSPITTAPTCSVNYGAAGVAYALLRIGKAQSRLPLLEAAERWLAVAERDQASPTAWYAPGLEAEVLGRVSPFHTGSGVAVVNARLAETRGDTSGHRRWLTAYLERVAAPTDNPDLTLGRASVVVGACHALAGADPTWPESVRLIARVGDLLDDLWHDVGHSRLEYLGVAHGWAGVLYASLLWSRAAAWQPPPELGARLADLAARAEPVGRGVCWPVFAAPEEHDEEYWSGWCNGQAGHVMLWTLAYDALGDERWRRLAIDAAWCVADAPVGVSSLCCGAAGEIYALLSVYRCTRDESWLRRALARAHEAAAHATPADDAPTPLSLYKGRVGLAVLGADLDRPAVSAMPLFEVEGTP